jgi:hypothetical protein
MQRSILPWIIGWKPIDILKTKEFIGVLGALVVKLVGGIQKFEIRNSKFEIYFPFPFAS